VVVRDVLVEVEEQPREERVTRQCTNVVAYVDADRRSVVIDVKKERPDPRESKERQPKCKHPSTRADERRACRVKRDPESELTPSAQTHDRTPTSEDG
jgi:hypothetical protein